MPLGAVGIGIENLLGDFQSLQRLAAQGELPLGEQGRGTGAAHHAFEKTAAAALRPLELCGAESLAAIEKSRLLLQQRGEDVNGIIVIAPVQGCLSLFILLAQGPGNLT